MKLIRCDVKTCGAEVQEDGATVRINDCLYDFCGKCKKIFEEWVKETLQPGEQAPQVQGPITYIPGSATIYTAHDGTANVPLATPPTITWGYEETSGSTSYSLDANTSMPFRTQDQ